MLSGTLLLLCSSFVGISINETWKICLVHGSKSVHKSENPSTRLSRFRKCVRDDTSGNALLQSEGEVLHNVFKTWLYHINLFSDIWLSCRGGLASHWVHLDLHLSEHYPGLLSIRCSDNRGCTVFRYHVLSNELAYTSHLWQENSWPLTNVELSPVQLF